MIDRLDPEALSQLIRLYRSEKSRVSKRYEEYKPEKTPDTIAIVELVKVIRMNEQLDGEFGEIRDELSSDHRGLQRKLTKAIWGR